MIPRIATLILSLLITFKVSAIEVVTSIKPLQLIALEVTLGVTEPKALLSSNVSPHDYALKPSDVKTIQKADLLVWFGPDLESFMSSVVKNAKHSIQLSKQPELTLRKYDDGGSHEGHDHGSYDSHIWLGPEQAKQFANILATQLKDLDPKNASIYTTNLANFEKRLNKQNEELYNRLLPYANEGYYVFHDAYGYFEEFFNLNNLGYFTVSPERKPGAKTLIQIRTTLKEKNVKCVFSEPQYTPAVIQSTIRGTNAKVGVIDPLATDIEAKPGAYFEFLNRLTTSFESCLGQ